MKFFVRLIFLFFCQWSFSQEDVSSLPGHVWHDKRIEANKDPIKKLFQIIEKVPLVGQPIGMDIQENYIAYDKNGNNGRLCFSMFMFYKQNGILKSVTNDAPTITIEVNQSKYLMDERTIFYYGGEGQSSLPVMFTDTLDIQYSDINGFVVGQAYNERFKHKEFVINPSQTALFRPVTQEEYLKFFIEKLRTEIEKESTDLQNSKADFIRLKNNPDLKDVVADAVKTNDAFQSFTIFKKNKLLAYQKKLLALSAAEKKAPAYWVSHKDIALPFKDGKAVAEITGHLDLEPAEENEDLLLKKPALTFSDNLTAAKAKSTISLLVISNPFVEEDVSSVNNPMKRRIEEEFFPLIPYREIAALMNK